MLLTIDDSIKAELIENAIKTRSDPNYDPKPPLKLFSPWGNSTWLITEMDPDNNDMLFGLCDRGLGCPECGHVSLKELSEITGPFGLRIEIDRHWTAAKTISQYTLAAVKAGAIER